MVQNSRRCIAMSQFSPPSRHFVVPPSQSLAHHGYRHRVLDHFHSHLIKNLECPALDRAFSRAWRPELTVCTGTLFVRVSIRRQTRALIFVLQPQQFPLALALLIQLLSKINKLFKSTIPQFRHRKQSSTRQTVYDDAPKQKQTEGWRVARLKIKDSACAQICAFWLNANLGYSLLSWRKPGH